MQDDLYFHRKIDFKILRETSKAILVQMISCDSGSVNNYLGSVENNNPGITSLLELWFPKSWIKKRGENFYIWEKGFFLNIKKLIEKRQKKQIEEEIKEADELIEEFDSLAEEIENKNRTVH